MSFAPECPFALPCIIQEKEKRLRLPPHPPLCRIKSHRIDQFPASPIIRKNIQLSPILQEPPSPLDCKTLGVVLLRTEQKRLFGGGELSAKRNSRRHKHYYSCIRETANPVLRQCEGNSFCQKKKKRWYEGKWQQKEFRAFRILQIIRLLFRSPKEKVGNYVETSLNARWRRGYG